MALSAPIQEAHMSSSPLADFYRPDVIQDPYPYYARLRQDSPIVRDPSGAWVVSSYQDISTLLGQSEALSSRVDALRSIRPDSSHPDISRGFDTLPRMFLFADPPSHTRLRGLVSKAFTPNRIQGMQGLIEHTVDDLLTRALGEGEIELMGDFAVPLPIHIICEMFAIPVADRATIKRWSADAVAFLAGAVALPHDEAVRTARSVEEYMNYFRELCEERKRAPGDDLLTALLQAEERGDALEREDVCATALMFITGGFETTTNLIGNGVLGLLRQPAVAQHLRENPSLWPTAIDELLRYDSPGQYIARLVCKPIEISNIVLEAGSVIYLVIGSGNRDPQRFEDPDRIDPARPRNRHLSFGLGPHYCIGAALARLEAEVAFRELFKRTRTLKARESELRWQPNAMFRGLSRFVIETE
jgi:cytochrome P450